MTNITFIKLVDALSTVSPINVNTIESAKKTFDNFLKVVRKNYGYDFEKELAMYGVSSCVSFRTWLREEATINRLRKLPKGEIIIKKLESSAAKN
jgi:hypothetical protein